MTVYSISYDLNKPGQQYQALYDAIISVSATYSRPLLSLWIVESSLTSEAIARRLAQHMDQDDKLLVMKASPDWVGYGLASKITDWMKSAII